MSDSEVVLKSPRSVLLQRLSRRSFAAIDELTSSKAGVGSAISHGPIIHVRQIASKGASNSISSSWPFQSIVVPVRIDINRIGDTVKHEKGSLLGFASVPSCFIPLRGTTVRESLVCLTLCWGSQLN